MYIPSTLTKIWTVLFMPLVTTVQPTLLPQPPFPFPSFLFHLLPLSATKVPIRVCCFLFYLLHLMRYCKTRCQNIAMRRQLMFVINVIILCALQQPLEPTLAKINRSLTCALQTSLLTNSIGICDNPDITRHVTLCEVHPNSDKTSTCRNVSRGMLRLKQFCCTLYNTDTTKELNCDF